MPVSTFNPQTNVPHDDGIRIMPTSDDLKRPHSEKQLIDDVMAELKRPNNLIASSRQEIPHISVNGVVIDPKTIAQEVQYHRADSQEDALFLSAQALVIRELLKQAVIAHDKLGQNAWQDDEEQAIARLLELEVHPQMPDQAMCRQYFDNNPNEFVSTPVVDVRHILLACPPDDIDGRLVSKKQADELIVQLSQSQNMDADFIRFAQMYSSCPSKDDGGELGVVQKGTTVSEFEKAIFNAPQGLIVNPIESRYGIHVAQIKSRIDGKKLNFEQAYPMIENRLKQESFHHHLCDYLFELGQKADIVGIRLQMNQDNVYRG
ncbi:MAG: peptidylprolyl isomerase [Moraxella sp.]|nr:peptidylprolyl isomerase [Moraxella sp.]